MEHSSFGSTIYLNINSKKFEDDLLYIKKECTECNFLLNNFTITNFFHSNELVNFFDCITKKFNLLLKVFNKVEGYLEYSHAAKLTDKDIKNKLKVFELIKIEVFEFETKFALWFKSIDYDFILSNSEVAKEYRFYFKNLIKIAHHSLSLTEESLAQELSIASKLGWIQLQKDLIGNLSIPFEIDGIKKNLSFSEIQSYSLSTEQREIRKQAYQSEMEALQSISIPIAKCLNNIKWHNYVITSKQGWKSSLEASLFQNGIDQEILDAMLNTIKQIFPSFQKYFQLKAHALKIDTLCPFDLMTPIQIQQNEEVWSYEKAINFILDCFKDYSPQLSEFASSAVEKHWVDEKIRTGKKSGDTTFNFGDGTSRILVNFNNTFIATITLAHELGHGYHNFLRGKKEPLNQITPMLLKETASTFCEQLIIDRKLKLSEPTNKITVLDSFLVNAQRTLLDIYSRFIFEDEVFKRRSKGELSVDEINEVMQAARNDVYGEAVNVKQYPSYRWESLSHYYRESDIYYNYQYIFGLLYSLALFANYKNNPKTFPTSFNYFLSRTGEIDIKTLSAKFGIDITASSFWESGITYIQEQIDLFESSLLEVKD